MKKSATPRPQAPPAPPQLREPLPREAAAMADAKARMAQRPGRVAVMQTETKPKTLSIGPRHADGLGWNDHLKDTFGTSSRDFCEQSMIRLATATRNREDAAPTEQQTNGALALMGAIAPRDELEAIIGEQIIATHTASLDFLNRARANAGEHRDSAAAYTNMACKVSRTMVAHIEALTRLRSGGKQQVIVKHIHIQGDAYVGDSGQAAFGLEGGHTWGVENENPRQPHALSSLGDVAGLSMRSTDTGRDTLPSPSGAREAQVQDARLREGRGGPEGKGERAVSDGASHPRASRSPRARSRRAGVGA